VRAVYDFAVAFNRSSIAPAELIDALVPLYYGRTAGLVLDTREATPGEFELYVDQQAQEFERQKPYLQRRWDDASRR
jgi:hypothetical protein